MTVWAWLVISAWWVLVAVMMLAICRAAGRADEAVERWDAERVQARDALAVREALDRMGENADELWS